MNEVHTCILCGKSFKGIGNNPEPLAQNNDNSRCCDECNDFRVIPARLFNMSQGKPARELIKKEEK